MPDTTQSNELRKFRTSFPPGKIELTTLSLNQRRQDVADELDIVYVVDTTSTMGANLTKLAASVDNINTALLTEYPSIRYGLVTFKDEDATATVLGGSAMASISTLSAAVTALSASGGGDTPDNGFGALYAASRLAFRDEAARAIVLITDSTSHSRGKTYLSTKANLLINRAFLFLGIDFSDAPYEALVASSGGSKLAGSTSSAFTANAVAALKKIANPVGDPIYIVNDNQTLTATLETGQNVTFLTRSFAINPFLSGDDGSPSIGLTIDNSDFAVSRYLANAKKFTIPLEVVLRVYLSNDLTGPQNNPPMKLFARDFETKGSTVACQLRWLDLVNSAFPNSFYTPTRCPSLQG